MSGASSMPFALDDGQRRAAASVARYILVVAGPGSGKTRVLSHRFAHLLQNGSRPEDLLAITFTNRAALEMRGRIEALSSVEPRSLEISTFHSFALRLLKKSGLVFRLVTRIEQKEILKGAGVKDADGALERISAIKNGAEAMPPDFQGLFETYAEGLEKTGGLDLDDLIIKAVEAVENGVDPGKAHVLVDEFQDINPAQARLVRGLAKDASIFAIGDPDQAIYSFRGGSSRAFLDFEKDFPGAEVVRLAKNYRSGRVIVEASNALISRNIGRMGDDASAITDGGEITEVECRNEAAEASFIVKEIERLMGGLSSLTVGKDEDARFSDFAVLYRTNRLSESLKEAFEKSSIPFHIVAHPGPGLSELAAILRSTAFEGTLKETVERALKDLGAGEEITAMALNAVGSCEDGAEGLKTLADELLLLSPPDNLDIKADKVNIMTMHAAKGLEWRCVFVAGFEDGLVPFKARDGNIDFEEERRLFYVGLTRALSKAYLIHAKERRAYGEAREAKVSPFLGEIPPEFLKKVTLDKKPALRRPQQKGLFES
ncbi:MAG: UvrD-helicase domain-containing protein [Deltaproteobacteria bacterium]|nr:UvrD-helicase domain-containing protein [Deltaproteobacteria bacterium]